MRNKIFMINLGLAAVLIGLLAYTFYNEAFHDHTDHQQGYYTCPMHPQIQEKEPGRCPICNMKLKYKDVKKEEHSENKILHYTCPMHPQIQEEEPGRCPICNMKLKPVYREKKSNETLVEIPLESQKLIGVKTTRVEKKPVNAEILTTGRVAFDPELSVAVREYLAVRNSDAELRRGAIARLKLLGMGEEEIRQLPFRSKAYESLYLPRSSGTVWVYATAYENELAYLRPGAKAEIQNPYLKNQKFTGVIRSLSPVVDPATRSITVRIEVPGAGGTLLPDSFVNVKIRMEMGISLVIPRSAMMDSGEKQIVFIMRDETVFVRRYVIAGPETAGEIVILSGLEEGELVVSSATFLIDSESRLHAAVPESDNHNH
ncbi:MAG: efflux RND transporter periplasmic adaptor subunit [Spirochaetia bacterium]|nr:efflux RND transporter periplasmic adaptor subunit [Spirochaetia bacterium]